MKKLLKKLLFELEYKRDYADYHILNNWCCLLKKLIKKFTKSK